jgi:hypothetical protein
MTTGDDDDDGDIEGVGDVVTCTSPVPLVPLGTIIALEDCDRDRQPHNTIRMTDRTSQLRASALLNSPSRSQVARSALRRLFRSSLLLLCRRCCCCSCRSVLCSLGAHAPPPPPFPSGTARLISVLSLWRAVCAEVAVAVVGMKAAARTAAVALLLWLFGQGALCGVFWI